MFCVICCLYETVETLTGICVIVTHELSIKKLKNLAYNEKYAVHFNLTCKRGDYAVVINRYLSL